VVLELVGVREAGSADAATERCRGRCGLGVRASDVAVVRRVRRKRLSAVLALHAVGGVA